MAIQDLTDEDLVRKLIDLAKHRPEYDSVEQQYFAEIFKRYADQLYSLCRYFGLRAPDADDVVQDTFFKLYDKITYLDPHRPLKPYLFKMVHNLTKNKFREVFRHPKLNIDDFSEKKADNHIDFSEEFGKNEDIRCMLLELPEKIREAIILKFYNGLEPPDIAEALSISVKSVYYRLDKGVEFLRGRMREDK